MTHRPYIGSETKFTISVADYLDLQQVLYTHVANEAKQDVKTSSTGKKYSPTGAKLKAMGKKKGVPDLLIFEPRGEYVGLAIELKVGRNEPSPEQELWLKRLANNGWHCIHSRSLDAVLETIDCYLNNKHDKL